MLLIDCPGDAPMPKRGDIVQTNVGNKRERTWLILHAHRVDRIVHSSRELIPRFKLWAARWWDLEADFRMRLFRSAERNGGQNVLFFYRHKAKKKPRKVMFV